MKTWRAWSIGLAFLAAVWPGLAQAQQDKQVVIYSTNEATLNSWGDSTFTICFTRNGTFPNLSKLKLG